MFHTCLHLGITVLPFSATREILQGQWPFGRTFCHIWLAIDVLYCTASIYGLMFISIERYIGVTRPLRYPLIITHRRTLWAIVSAWLVAIFISITPYVGWQTEVTSIDASCLVNDHLSYVLFSCSFSFYIPLIVILCVYGRIYGEARRQYRFLIDGEKQVRLKDFDGHDFVRLRVHIPQHLSTSTSSLSTTHHHVQRRSTQMLSSGANKLTKFKREKKAGRHIAKNHFHSFIDGSIFICFHKLKP
jgi:adrenergic receptor alpha-1D